jgi:hypothetical protein
MKKNLFDLCFTVSIITIFCFISSCSKKDGFAEAPEFEFTPIFSNTALDTIIKSKNDVKWWFNEFGLYINEKQTDFKDPEIKLLRDPAAVGSDSPLGFIRKFENEWFIIEKLNNREIRISLKKNDSYKKRSLIFGASVGNAQKIISLEQNP